MTADENYYIKVKGTSWMLEHDVLPQKNLTELKNTDISKIQSQKKKWKKNTNNRFEGVTKKIEKFIEYKFEKENEKFN